MLTFLAAVRPESARQVVRALWPALRSAKSDDLDVKPPSPALAARLRRHVFSRFALVAEREREGIVGALLLLSRSELYRIVQDAGLREISRIGGGDRSREVLRLLKGSCGDDTAGISRLLAEEAELDAAGGGGGEEKSTDPARARALELIRRAVDSAGGEGDLVGLVGIGKIAVALSGCARRTAEMLAQRMSRPVGIFLLRWRNEFALRERDDRDVVGEEILERMGTILSRESSQALARGDS